MRWGTTKETRSLDMNGSTVTEEKNYMDGKVVQPIRKHYADRIKVKNEKEELTEILKFRDKIDKDKMKDIGIDYEYTKHGNENGYYFLVFRHTELMYES